MPSLKFQTLIWDEKLFHNLHKDANFKEFIFQIVNEDSGGRDMYGLRVFGRDNMDKDYPIGMPLPKINPDSLVPSTMMPNHVQIDKRILLGSIKMDKKQLGDVSPLSFKFLKFEADNIKTKIDGYITYKVYAVDASENPITFLESPSEIYGDWEVSFDSQTILEKIGNRKRIVAVVNPKPPPP